MTPIAESGASIPLRRWRILLAVRTGPERQAWAEHEMQIMLPHTPLTEAVRAATDAYKEALDTQPELALTMCAEIQECWLAENGGLVEFYTTWLMGHYSIIESRGHEWEGHGTWPPTPYEV